MPLEQALITWAHLVSAAIWVGGGLFLGAVLAPVLKNTSMNVQERMGLMIKVGRRFNIIAIPALAILIGTGLYNSRLVIANSDILSYLVLNTGCLKNSIPTDIKETDSPSMMIFLRSACISFSGIMVDITFFSISPRMILT